MSEEDKKIVIVVGAGASADFNPKHFSFPVGEALIKMICNKEEVASFFWNEICESFRNVVSKKIDQAMINFHDIFCDFLIDRDVAKDIKEFKELNFSQITVNFSLYLGKNFNKFKNTITFCYYDGSNVHRGNVEANLYQLYKDINANEEDCFEEEKNDKKECKFYKIIIANCNSRHLQISRLVNYYQPFSIDELLDSIKTDKIDILEPLNLDSSELKNILKDSENKSDEELRNQFKNELINAGKTLIALFLLRSEKRDLFDNPNPQNDAKIWYRHIRNLIINSGKNDNEIVKKIENITVISFNYDRSLDYYLRTRLKKYYDKIEKRIFYPYGKLAVDNWDCDDYGKYNKDGKFNPYNDNELREIEELGQGLRVIGELDEEVVIQEELDKETKKKLKDFQDLKNRKLKNPNNNSGSDLQDYLEKIFRENYIDKLNEIYIYLGNKNEEFFDERKQQISKHQKDCNFFLKRYQANYSLLQCKKIYFLGFAFHEPNCDLLTLKETQSCSDKNIYYTNFDESESLNKMVKSFFNGDTFINPSKRKGVYEALMHDFKLGF
jgi:hypothetical protein